MVKLKYVPTWEDQGGNILIFPDTTQFFDDLSDANTEQVNGLLYALPLGLKSYGVININVSEDGKFNIPNIKGQSEMGDVLYISGTQFNKALEDLPEDQKQRAMRMYEDAKDLN